MKSININSNQLVSILRNALPTITEIYLFGSQSRNCEHSNSDIDVFIRANSLKENTELLSSEIKLPNYIDAFLDAENKAIGMSTKFIIEEKNSTALKNRLKPVKLWDNTTNKVCFNKQFFINNTNKVTLTVGG